MANASTAKIAREKSHREPKEATTEPTADKLAHENMKKGGHAKHKAMGGAMMAPPMAPRRRMAMQRAPMTAQPPMMAKKGGEVESKTHERAEMREMKKIEKELKHHEHMKAGKAHHGLKKGGKASMYEPHIGGLLGEGMPHHKGKTGGIEGAGYKHGGKAHHISGHPEGSHEHHKHMAKHHLKMHKEGGSAHHKKMHEHHKAMCGGGKMAEGGLAEKGDKFQTEGTLKPKIDVNDKVVGAKQTKSFHTKTTGVEGKGYKKGGTIHDSKAKHYLNDMEDGSKPHKKSGKTGEIHQSLAGYKKGGHVKHHADGGHVAHHTTMGHDDCGHTSMHKMMHKEGGHEKMSGHPMKHGGSAHKKHHKNY